MSKRKLIIVILVIIGLVLLWELVVLGNRDETAPGGGSSQTNANQPSNTAGFDKQRFSTTDPASPWVIVNKQHPLNPIDYRPGDLVAPSAPLRVPGNETMLLRQEAAAALEQLFAGAKADGHDLMVASGFRSHGYQANLYNGYVTSQGQAAADRSSARPGYSEHQTGWAVDVEPAGRNCELDTCFGDTPEGKWVAAHAATYGFIIRYTEDKEAVTGYQYEPWHLRYVGTDLAAELRRQKVTTLEEFFGVSGGQNY